MSMALDRETLESTGPDDLQVYRALSWQAVAALVLGLLSPLTVLSPWLGTIPLASLLLAAAALVTVRRYPQEYTGGGLACAGAAASLLFLVGGWSYHAYAYAAELPDGYTRLSFAQLQTPTEAPYQAPAEVRDLEGQRVFIKGFIRPGSQNEQMRKFLLVKDDNTCCFGTTLPAPGDMIEVTMAPGLSTTYDLRMKRVGGVLRIRWEPIFGGVGKLYHLEADYLQ